MSLFVHIFVVTDFDFYNMQPGVSTMISGINPWAEDTRLDHFYNPPFSILFLWPLVFLSPKSILIMGAALRFAVPLPWLRYVIPMMPFVCIWIAFGILQVISGFRINTKLQ
jgi:hypothetical protein